MKKSELEAMKQSIQEGFASLGATINFDGDTDLKKLVRGHPLLLKELREMPDGTPVFVTYRKDGERGFRINDAMRIKRGKDGEDYWSLDDGSSFGADFTPDSDDGEEPCYEDTGRGPMYLYRAEQPAEPPAKKPARKTRKKA